MRIFEMGFTKEIIVLFNCYEKDVHDTKGNYSFTLVVGKDNISSPQVLRLRLTK